MDAHHYTMLKNRIAMAMDDQRPNMWESYHKDGLPFSQYIWNLIFRTDLHWIEINLYPYLHDAAIEAAARKMVWEYAKIKESDIPKKHGRKAKR